MRIKITVSYDGTDFSGWQRQKNGISIQETLESAILKITGEKVTVTGSGRTDAGVHAEGQVAHFDLNKSKIPPENLKKALNTVLPDSVKVLKSEKTKEDFNSCRTAKQKTYRYSIYFSDVEKPLKERYATRFNPVKFDIESAKKISELFMGEHDFKCFTASGSGAKTTIRKIYSIKIKKEKEDLFIEITGNGFLYNMVRIMVSVILGFSVGKISGTEVKEMLASGKRPFSIKTLPSKGLCLIRVKY